jgi:uracil-DNA glycosylase
VENCAQWLRQEIRVLEPHLIIPVGRLAIERFIPCPRMDEVIGVSFRSSLYGRNFDLIPLPHPSGASPWPRIEPGKTLLARAMTLIARHEAFRATFS